MATYIGGVDYVYVDFQGVREAFEKRAEVYLSEDDADVAVSIEMDARRTSYGVS